MKFKRLLWKDKETDRYVIFAVGNSGGVLPTCDSWSAVLACDDDDDDDDDETWIYITHRHKISNALNTLVGFCRPAYIILNHHLYLYSKL